MLAEPNRMPTKLDVRCLLILHADHELNASTFTTRVVVGERLRDMYGCVTAGIAALAGPLHGGANTAVMKMLLDDRRSGQGRHCSTDALTQEKDQGIGHAVTNRGPACTWLRRYSKTMGTRQASRSG